MLDVTTIILTYNEELHIKRCLENVCRFSKKVYVIDSPSMDKTVEICNEFPNVEVVIHKYPGNQAEQFNWAIDNLLIDTEWVLRMDADEYCTLKLIDEMYEKLPYIPKSINAIVLPLGRSFRGKLLKHSIVSDIKMIRLFRYGKARYESRIMDEHLTVLEGNTTYFENLFIDDNLCSIQSFIDKHNGYSSKEAALLLAEEFALYAIDGINSINSPLIYAKEVSVKRNQKATYAKLPLYWRAIGYFFYRYVFKFGFLDGRAGFEWDFFQGLWYRLLVDSKISEVKRYIRLFNIDVNTPEGKSLVKDYIKTSYGIEI